MTSILVAAAVVAAGVAGPTCKWDGEDAAARAKAAAVCAALPSATRVVVTTESQNGTLSAIKIEYAAPAAVVLALLEAPDAKVVAFWQTIAKAIDCDQPEKIIVKGLIDKGRGLRQPRFFLLRAEKELSFQDTVADTDRAVPLP